MRELTQRPSSVNVPKCKSSEKERSDQPLREGVDAIAAGDLSASR
ncbi:MAG: hypothetical protein Hyperionvirus39_13 [Hyperionvirus sp.]|uniref:Uncharacterized protein n=1 Tax=Hyperionvirus sp. TaxID=2487770 RepID=A0A3G5AFX0_9VIRU|nr:MAG: hypothetical protein Hyperionvirus39_13 [Hyperionvirus sp.]